MKIKKAKIMLNELREERKTIREFSIFGTENWVTLDKEIELIGQLLKKPTSEALQDLILDIEDEIEDIENESEGDSDYQEMDEKRQPLENTLSMLMELK